MKSRSNPRHKSDLAFLDMLFNFIIAFAFLFMIAIMLVKPTAKAADGVKLSAEFLINMSWPDAALDDIDMWVLLPNGKKVSFHAKDQTIATLDRDDRGGYGDTYLVDPLLSDKKGLIQINKETITIRAIVPGHYVVAAHVFALYAKVEDFQNEIPMPYEATLEILKLNPRLVTVATSKVLLERWAQRATFISFDIAPDGSVINIVQNPDEDIIGLYQDPDK